MYSLTKSKNGPIWIWLVRRKTSWNLEVIKSWKMDLAIKKRYEYGFLKTSLVKIIVKFDKCSVFSKIQLVVYCQCCVLIG